MRHISSFKVLCFFFAATILTGCHSNKSVNKDNTSSLATATVNDINTLYDQLVESYSDWTVAYIPVTLALDSKNGMSISGRLTMTYDQDIYISLRMLGMEVAQVYADNKDVYIVDKFHKVYIHEEISTLADKYGLGIKDLQNLLLGKAAVPGLGRVTVSSRADFDFLSADDQWIMSPKKQYEGSEWSYMLSMTEPPALTAMSLRVTGYGAVELLYSNPTPTPSGITANELYITAQNNDRTFKAVISYDLKGAEWDSNRSVTFKKPGSSYKQLSMSEMLYTLGSF